MLLPLATERRAIGREVARPQIVRAAESTAAPRFVGHAAVFNTRVLIGRLPWGFYEDFAPGSFSDTIADGGASLGIDQAHLLDHDSYYVVSRAAAETLRLAEDKTGLAVDSDLDTRVSYINDHIANLENGNITGMSIGFWVDDDVWGSVKIKATGPDGEPVELDVETRTVLKASLLEVSSVTFPAFPTTDAGLRDVAGALARRGDPAALERYAERAPILRELVTRAGQLAGATHLPAAGPAALARRNGRREAELAARYGLPLR